MVPLDLLRIMRQSEAPDPLSGRAVGGCLTVAFRADVSQVDDGATRGYSSGERGKDMRVFRAALRHSRRVRLLRIGIPGAVVLAGLIIVLSVYVLDPLRQLAKLPQIGGLVVSGTLITIQQPRMGGYTQDRRPCVVAARAECQDRTKPDAAPIQGRNDTLQLHEREDLEAT